MAEQNTECNECPRDYLADSGMLTWPEQITDKICHWKKCHPEKRRRDNARLHDIVLARFHHCCVRGILRYSTLTVMDEMNADNLACRTMCQLILLDRGISIRFSTWIENGSSRFPNGQNPFPARFEMANGGHIENS